MVHLGVMPSGNLVVICVYQTALKLSCARSFSEGQQGRGSEKGLVSFIHSCIQPFFVEHLLLGGASRF